MHVCMCICMCVYVYMYIPMYIHVYIYIYTSTIKDCELDGFRRRIGLDLSDILGMCTGRRLIKQCMCVIIVAINNSSYE